MRALACLVLTITLTACLTSPDKCAAINPSNPATETYASSLNIDLSQMSKTVNGVYTQDVVVGSGQTLSQPTNVQVYYVAYLPDGTVVDQQLQKPFLFDLRTITAAGVLDGMLGMNVGGRRRMVVPSELALGACGHGPIPPNSTLIYEIELLEIDS
ncbi:MAG: FKBP-type peptidyl-prolyl cis-trans isomerase [Gemmatimonadaceae bacterium]